MKSLTEEQTRDRIKNAGGNWDVFRKWMLGQTYPLLENGEGGYYEYDVNRFIRYDCNPDNEPYWEFD